MGREKGRLRWAGIPMAERVASALGSCVQRVRVVVRPGAIPPVELPRVEDRLPVDVHVEFQKQPAGDVKVVTHRAQAVAHGESLFGLR